MKVTMLAVAPASAQGRRGRKRRGSSAAAAPAPSTQPQSREATSSAMASGMGMPLMLPCLIPQLHYFVPYLMSQPQGVARILQLGSMIPGKVYDMPPSLPVEQAASQPGSDPNALAIQQWNGGGFGFDFDPSSFSPTLCLAEPTSFSPALFLGGLVPPPAMSSVVEPSQMRNRLSLPEL